MPGTKVLDAAEVLVIMAFPMRGKIAVIYFQNLMSLPLIFFTVLCVVGISLGQLLFKKAAMALPVNAHWVDWIFNGWLVVALGLYGVTTVLWVWILRSAPLHLAYPFMGLAFVLVPAIGWYALGEPLRWQTLIGGCLILAGVTLAAQAGP